MGIAGTQDFLVCAAGRDSNHENITSTEAIELVAGCCLISYFFAACQWEQHPQEFLLVFRSVQVYNCEAQKTNRVQRFTSYGYQMPRI
jgi:hypothetical protein